MSSLERGLDLLDFLAERGELRLAEVAAQLQTSRATAFRMLTVLKGMHDANPSWGPLFLAHPGNIYRDVVYRPHSAPAPETAARPRQLASRKIAQRRKPVTAIKLPAGRARH